MLPLDSSSIMWRLEGNLRPDEDYLKAGGAKRPWAALNWPRRRLMTHEAASVCSGVRGQKSSVTQILDEGFSCNRNNRMQP